MLRIIFRSALLAETLLNRFKYPSGKFSPTSLYISLISKICVSNVKKIDSFPLQRHVKKLSKTQFPGKSSAVLFSGILTFLGLQQKDSDLVLKIKRGILYIKRGEFQRAENVLHSALRMAYDEQNEDGITYIYDVLANLAFDTGQNAKAEKLFISVVQRLTGKGVEVNDNKVIHISLKLAKVYERTKDYKKAESGYKYCLDRLKEKIEDPTHEGEHDIDLLNLWISSLDTYARFLSNTGRPDEALINFRKAYEMSIEINGKESEVTALLLNDMGVTLNQLGDSDGAITHIKEAIEIGTKLTKMEDLPEIYISLGYLYLMKGMYNESKISCDKGMRRATVNEDDELFLKAKECLKKIDEVLKNNVK